MFTAKLILLLAATTFTFRFGTRPAEELLREMTPQERAEAQREIERARPSIERQMAPVVLYAKVVDQNGTGVAGAAVTVDIRYWHNDGLSWVLQFKRVQLSTSADGEFRMDGSLRGELVTIREVVKEGYEFRGETKWRGIYPTKYKPDPRRPEIVRLRKRGPATFLIPIQGGADIRSADQVVAVDLFAARSLDPTTLADPDPDDRHLVADLKYRAALQPGGKEYLVTIEASAAESSGVRVLDDVLFVAPVDGYTKTATIRVPTNDEPIGPIHVCLRTRWPELFARLDFRFRAEPDELEIRDEGVADPYGGRNLEFEEALIYSPRYTKLLQFITDDFLHGRRPQPPDIARLIQEGQAAKRIKEQARRAPTSRPASGPFH